MDWNAPAVISGLAWLIILLLPWRPWGTAESMDCTAAAPEADLRDITALIPARNEAGTIEKTLSSLQAQGQNLSIVVVDDQSTDGTGDIARAQGASNLRVVSGNPLPADWAGKLWALEQGFCLVNTPLTLLIDADIELQPGILCLLRQRMRENGLGLVSLMAQMHMVSFWEKLLMPAFVYFFKMLYPFRLSNSEFRGVAAAAGGCILIETRLIREIDGFEAIRKELIDDCTLAKKVKSHGYRTWVGLTHSVHSLRSYSRLSGIWQMVTRTAACQLRYSVVFLTAVTLAMATLFWLPVAGLVFPSMCAKIISAGALLALVLTYLPTLRFYGRPMGWALVLPLIATLYLVMTWASMIQYWFGLGSSWKGRSYKRVRDGKE